MGHVLVTGAAGFIGMHVCRALLERGDEVVGIDNLSSYYDVGLKKARLAQLSGSFRFIQRDIADRDAMLALAQEFPGITGIVHLAAQPGVRYSLIDPYIYVQTNIMGQVVMFELARRLGQLNHFVYASSSSVYGANTKMPFAVSDAVDHPNSLYAATKRMDELTGHAYSHLYNIPSTGLRFFTVYGPWGRPDMAPLLFTRAILKGDPIHVFNHGEMWRDFTYIDDIADGVLRSLDRRPTVSPPHVIYNLGNNKVEKLTDFITLLEKEIGRPALLQLEPMQPGDVPSTYADIESSRRDLGFEPNTPISVGIPRLIAWYRDFYGA